MSRIDQVSALLHQELAALLPRHLELPNALVTVTHVRCTADLRWANVHISVMPEQYNGTALAELRRRAGDLSAALRTRLRLRRLPKINWLIDSTEAKAAELEAVFKQAAEADRV